MNEQLQGKLVEILTSIQEASRAAGDFALEHLPDIAQSYVLYGRVTATAFFLAALFATVGFAYVAFAKGFLSGERNEMGLWTDSRFAAALAGSCGLVLSVMLLVVNFSQLSLVWLAPKVWLLKELAALVR